MCRVSGSPGIAVSFRNVETDTVYRPDVIFDGRVQAQQVQDGADQVRAGRGAGEPSGQVSRGLEGRN